MAELKVWVCANCKTPVEPTFPQGFDDLQGLRCPGTDPSCSPRDDRELLTEEQVEAVDLRQQWESELLSDRALNGALDALELRRGGPLVDRAATGRHIRADLEAALQATREDPDAP